MMPPPPDAHAEETLVAVSALQHYLFCPRQCGLIHIERIWAEDGATAEGRLLHERVDGGKADNRQGVRTVRSLTIRSFALGVTGKADAVEFHGSGNRLRLFPVEYKRGRPKAHRADEVQLCAQAMCLEEMFSVPVPEGALFYGATHKRQAVRFDDPLRLLTHQVATNVREMVSTGRTPLPKYMPGCKKCSLMEVCKPKRLERPPSVARWLARQLTDRPEEV